MHSEPYPASFTPRNKKPSHSSSEETSSEFVWLEIKITRKQKCGGKPKQVLCRYISYYDPPLVDCIFSLHWFRDIYRRYFLRNIQIISLSDYKEKIEIYTKYLEKKSNWVGRKYLGLHRWISQLELSISQEKVDFVRWVARSENGIWIAKWHTSACRWFRKLILQLQNFLSTWCNCLQMAITSSFQLWFAHRLKRLTHDFSSFETIYIMCKMDSRKCLKCVLRFLYSWVSSC